MAPELDKPIVADPYGIGLALLVVEINGSAGACANGIEFDTVPGEADPVTATRINICIVWPTHGSAQFRGIGLKMDAGKLFEPKTGLFFFLWVFSPIIVQVLPEHTPPGSHISVVVRIKVKVTDGALECGTRPGLLNVKQKGSGGAGKTVVGECLAQAISPNRCQDREDT